MITAYNFNINHNHYNFVQCDWWMNSLISSLIILYPLFVNHCYVYWPN